MATVRWSEDLISHSDNIITDVKRVLSVSADMSPSLGPSRCMRPLTTDCSMDIRIIVFERVIASVGVMPIAESSQGGGVSCGPTL
jgi:hypothetical protein